MIFRVLTTDQRSEAWRFARCGCLTGSQVADALKIPRNREEPVGRRNLRIQLVLERLTQRPCEEGFVSKDMQRGAALEAEALVAYEALKGQLVSRVGFLAHPVLLTGCSPDGEVDGFDGIVEIKCPKSATHLDYLRTKTIPNHYIKQITHSLWITGARWCDFISYDPRFPLPLQRWIVRVLRTDVDIAAHELLVRLFLSEVDREYAEIEAMTHEVLEGSV